MQILREDPFTGKLNAWEIDVTQEQLDRWESGEMIQRVMSNLSPEEREFIMTGMTPDTWDEVTGEEA
jgi:hypothetical protein